MPSTVIDYTSRGYAELKDAMLANATTLLPQWTSRSPNDFGVVLVELFAYMGDILNFYADRIANESFLSTATQRSSVLQIASMLDYVPSSTRAATVTLTFTTAPGSGAVTIPAATQVTTVSADTEPVYFETTAALTIAGTTGAPNVFTGTVTAAEGRTIFESVGASSGMPGQDFVMTQSPVIQGSLDIFMDEGSGLTTWVLVDHLISSGPLDKVYVLYVDANGITHVTFGDGVNGKIPAALTSISTGYRVGGGIIGNVGPSTLTTLNSAVVGVISVTNVANAAGGQDAETLDQIRVNAPAALLSLNRAVTLSDYQALALKVQNVGKAIAVSTIYTSVTLYVAPIGGGLDASNAPIYLSAASKAAVTSYLADKIPATTTVTLADPTYVGIDVTLNLVVAPQYNQKGIETAVRKALLSFLSFDNSTFGQRVTLGGVFSALNSVIGVGYGAFVTMARSGGAGTADVVLANNEIPVPGTITITSSGGILT